MAEEIVRWRELASRLGVEIIAPVAIVIGDKSVTFTALFPQFGTRKGMIADADWERIKPHADTLLKFGYGYSTVTLGSDDDDEGAQDMLRDWGWSASEPTPHWW